MGHWETVTCWPSANRNRGADADQRNLNGEAFLAYIDQCLLPTLKRRDIVVIDNVSFHKVSGVEEAIQLAAQASATWRSIRGT
jgi:hypothetical protein